MNTNGHESSQDDPQITQITQISV